MEHVQVVKGKEKQQGEPAQVSEVNVHCKGKAIQYAGLGMPRNKKYFLGPVVVDAYYVTRPFSSSMHDSIDWIRDRLAFKDNIRAGREVGDQVEIRELKGRLTEVISNCDALCKRIATKGPESLVSSIKPFAVTTADQETYLSSSSLRIV
ncbi:hypothetical protein JHK82_052759 [Glycine max]|nr:hypothetical protein JHK86_052607 [Glycine max]KAG4926972.1 hypothetical protein JHK85_053458 [Glycine max]KAG5082604.1 hypothetical protein JHK84_052642 [Glycine max]KAG5085362.1 hypothetical protein JHK82_052759 [Glycine max]